jgi:AcrR family transcriptional regulator
MIETRLDRAATAPPGGRGPGPPPVLDTKEPGLPIDIVKPPKRYTLAPAKLRILETADALFYDEGIRAVGIDRLISTSSVTKATFYKHYGSKDRLILEYVAFRHLQVAEVLDAAAQATDDPEELLHEIARIQARFIAASGFRGCPFLNAATEFTDPAHPVRRAVEQHREWFHDILETLLRAMGHPLPGDAADDLVLARDGAMAGGYAGDTVAASASMLRVYDLVIQRAAGRAAA